MKILFDIGHPAHVHLFKNLIYFFQKNGDKIIVVSRDKDITTTLLDHYKIKHIIISKQSIQPIGMIKELIIRNIKIIKIYQKEKFDIAIGTSFSIGILSLLFNVRSYLFSEDDDKVIPLMVYLSYPFATKIINPNCLKFKYFKNKRILHNSYQKLAYLHPNNFKPQINVLKKYNLKPYKYIIIRLSALKAHHDLHAKGIDQKLIKKINKTCSNYQIISSQENGTSKIKPWDMHHVLNYAKMIISDSQSMTVEAAVLGVPSIRYGNFKGKISVLNEIEKYKLSSSFLPNQKNKMFKKIEEIINQKNIQKIYQTRKKNLLKNKTDFTKWMINYFSSLNIKGK
ncbi:MAG: DUF354 domain-containing protein [Candidatus Gracilibacteria bacterium]|nr:DUF354 domain-containing protein [Candidatus Gracilibacteria bacterium]